VASLPSLRLDGPASVKVGDIVQVRIELDSTADLRGMPLQLSFDKDVLSLLAVEDGGYFSRDGEKVAFTQAIQAADGVARAEVRREAATGASGRGTVFALRFKAIKTGTATVAVTRVGGIGLGNEVFVPPPRPLGFAIH
jgi:general secretion pathway protein D